MQSVKLINIFGHFIIRQFEKTENAIDHADKFRLEILFSPGSVDDFSQINFQNHSRPMKEYILINNDLKMSPFLSFFEHLFKL